MSNTMGSGAVQSMLWRIAHDGRSASAMHYVQGLTVCALSLHRMCANTGNVDDVAKMDQTALRAR